jgi:putative phosphoribosyl transferase
MVPLFMDRADAARQLARQLRAFANTPNLIILGLPRGGVPIAEEVARALGGRLDVFLVRKLGVPSQPELAMGAIASGGVRILNPDVLPLVGITREELEVVARREEAELARREQLYRGHRPLLPLAGATVVLVDDGVATGSTMLAAVRAVRSRQPARLVVAAPVMSQSAYDLLAREADLCVAVAVLEQFYGVGAWYRDFQQLSDAEVIAALDRARERDTDEAHHAAHG